MVKPDASHCRCRCTTIAASIGSWSRDRRAVTNGEKVFLLDVNESTFIRAEQKHRLENPGEVDLTFIEVQTGDYLGEDDIVRFSDTYGRV